MKKILLSSLIVLVTLSIVGGAVYLYTKEPVTQKVYAEPPSNPSPTGAEEGVAWRQKAWRDEQGQIPPDAFTRAFDQKKAAIDSQYNGSEFAPPASRYNWTSRGPQNVGGRTRSVVIHPTNPNILWAGSVSGGVWKSNDGGQTWIPLNDFMQNLAISSMAIDPNNPNVLYCGTGEGFYNGDGLTGGGMFKTTDGGLTWQRLPNTFPTTQNPDDWNSINRISIAHNNSNLILASTRGGIRRSTDGGNSWTKVFDTYLSQYVAFDPTNSSKAIADLIDYDSSISSWYHKAVYSTDGGVTWQNSNLRLNDFFGRIELAYAKSNPNIVYALHPDSGGGKVSRSTDGGHNFTLMTSTAINEGNLWYTNTIWVSPVNPDFIVVGIYSLHKSTNAGASFTKISDGYLLTNQPHPDQHCIVSDPGFNGTSNKRVYSCNDGGVFRTDDITTANTSSGWVGLNRTYQTTQYYGGAGNGTTGLLYGGTQDNGTLRLLPSSLDAFLSFGGDGGFSAVDPDNDNYCYGEYVGLRIHRSTNRGATADYIYSGITDVDNNLANFIAPFILDPNNSSRMLAGGRSLWRTNNVKAAGQPTWTAIRNGPNAHTISAIAVAKGNSDIIWVAENTGGSDGKIYKTTNGTAATPTWTTIDNNSSTNPLPNRYPTRILIDKNNHNTVYVTFGGFTDGNLRRTTDGGQTWADVTGSGATSLPFVPIRTIVQHPTNSNTLLAGTEIGIFVSENGGASWLPENEGPANVSVDELAFLSNSTTLLASTHGRGMWTTNVDVITPDRTVLFDFDGDGRSDISVFRPSNTIWYLQQSTAGFGAAQFGVATDLLAPGDFDGDRKADISVFRPSNGVWYRLNSSNLQFVAFQFGLNGDIPVPGDFDGDNKADYAVFRPSDGTWYVNKSSGGIVQQQFGTNGDKPLLADYDGDGKNDLAVFRPSDHTFYWLYSSNGQFGGVSFGYGTDIPVPADYEGDGKTDVAVFRHADGTWYWLNSSNWQFGGVQFGQNGDSPAPADYDGDGKADQTVFRNGIWYILSSMYGFQATQFGLTNDKPVPGAFVR